MFVVIDDSIYVKSAKGFTKCVLQKAVKHGRDVYSLKETSTHLTPQEFSEEYEVLTFPEVIARYGSMAVDISPSTVTKMSKGG